MKMQQKTNIANQSFRRLALCRRNYLNSETDTGSDDEVVGTFGQKITIHLVSNSRRACKNGPLNRNFPASIAQSCFRSKDR